MVALPYSLVRVAFVSWLIGIAPHFLGLHIECIDPAHPPALVQFESPPYSHHNRCIATPGSVTHGAHPAIALGLSPSVPDILHNASRPPFLLPHSHSFGCRIRDTRMSPLGAWGGESRSGNRDESKIEPSIGERRQPGETCPRLHHIVGVFVVRVDAHHGMEELDRSREPALHQSVYAICRIQAADIALGSTERRMEGLATSRTGAARPGRCPKRIRRHVAIDRNRHGSHPDRNW